MSKNRLISPFIIDHKDESNYLEILQEHSDVERIAFIDETFVEPAYDTKGVLHPGYYSFAAVIVEADDIAKFREDLPATLGGITYWHTTAAYNDKAHQRNRENAKHNLENSPWHVRKNIQPMLDTLGRHSQDGKNIVTLNFHVPYDADPSTRLSLRKAARAEALTALATHLTNTNPPTTTFIFDEPDIGPKEDEQTFQRLENAGLIPHVNAIFTKPTNEPLLWAADLLAWASRHLLNETEPKWLDNSKIKARFLDSHVQTELKTLNIRPLNQPSPRMKLYDEGTYREAGTPGTRTEAEATFRAAEANGDPVWAGPDKKSDRKNFAYRNAKDESMKTPMPAEKEIELAVGRGYLTEGQAEKFDAEVATSSEPMDPETKGSLELLATLRKGTETKTPVKPEQVQQAAAQQQVHRPQVNQSHGGVEL
ncbi:hypothetical protein [Rothia mucilaginosa]|uniref:hypothetical protein n=1 Tax=Rothia mucilaginosa TaxID=43675 RepID=UPI0028EF873B|nr:hypothetical protein [Rothia mucilaginosa]